MHHLTYFGDKKLALILRILFSLEIISLIGITSYLAASTDRKLDSLLLVRDGCSWNIATPGSLPVGVVLCTDDNGLPPILGALLLCVFSFNSVITVSQARLLLSTQRGIPLVYGSILMFLALYQAGRVWNETHGIQGVDLVRVLIQDQAIYFIMFVRLCGTFVVLGLHMTNVIHRVLFCTVANIIAAASPISPFSSYVLEAAGSPTFLCVVGNHLLIHLKEAVEEGRNEGTSYRMKTISAMGFEQDGSAGTSS